MAQLSTNFIVFIVNTTIAQYFASSLVEMSIWLILLGTVFVLIEWVFDEKDYIIEYETTVVGKESVFMAQFSIIL